MDVERVEALEKKIRKKMAYISYKTKRGHLSSAYSSLEILLTLYFGETMNYNPSEPEWINRDRLILSKGHAGLAQYMVLIEAGIMNEDDISNFAGNASNYSTHPILNLKKGLEMSSGSLGHGMAFAIGEAYSAKLNNLDFRVFVLLGDGELQEGSNWEAFLLANALNLDNLVVIIDKNDIQLSGKTEEIVPLGDLNGKLSSFGFEVIEVDGHNLVELRDAFNRTAKEPLAVIAKTVKGKGLSFIENSKEWHGKGLSDSDWETAKEELKIEEFI